MSSNTTFIFFWLKSHWVTINILHLLCTVQQNLCQFSVLLNWLLVILRKSAMSWPTCSSKNSVNRNLSYCSCTGWRRPDTIWVDCSLEEKGQTTANSNSFKIAQKNRFWGKRTIIYHRQGNSTFVYHRFIAPAGISPRGRNPEEAL